MCVYARLVLFSDTHPSIHEKEKENQREGKYRYVSTQLKDELQVSLVLIYNQLLLFFWKEQVAYSPLFWLTIKIWM
jgi:hypothetical protein